jgi:tetratricopeptide (TPR) repeat protein
MGKLKEALGTLTELENMFPDEAARAAWTKATYYKEAGDRPRAIAQARRVLKVYPKAPESSHAHQMLEEFGIATGGGVVDEEG